MKFNHTEIMKLEAIFRAFDVFCLKLFWAIKCPNDSDWFKEG